MDLSQIDIKTRLDLLDVPQKAMDALIWRNSDQYADCFTENAVWDLRPLIPHPVKGRAAIRQFFIDAWDSLEWAAQGLYFSRIVEFDGTHAKLRNYLGEWGPYKGGNSVVGFAMYIDDCVLEDGVWRIANHNIVPIYLGSADYAKPLFQMSPHRGISKDGL